METKHTPGPWSLFTNPITGAHAIGAADGPPILKGKCSLDDARIAAAAQDMYAACVEALDYIGTCSKGAVQDQLRAAIQKARGK